MVASELESGERRSRRRGTGPAIAISLAVHAAFFLSVGLIVPRPRLSSLPAQPPLSVILIPPREALRPAPRRKVGASKSAAERPPPPVYLPHLHIPRTATPNPPPSPVAAAPTNPAPAGKPGPGVAAGPLPYEESDRGVRAFLRGTVGCETPDAVKLTPQERARCNEHLAQDARAAKPFVVAGHGRGAFPSDRQSEGFAAPPIASCKGQGSNLGVGWLSSSEGGDPH